MCEVTLDWQPGEPFAFLGNKLLYRLEKREKTPPWVVVYSGGKTSKIINNLAPRYPHKFRLKIILKASAVASLTDDALTYYGDEETVCKKLKEIQRDDNREDKNENESETNSIKTSSSSESEKRCIKNDKDEEWTESVIHTKANEGKWLESQWSEETWTSTDPDGPSAVSFCMAVRCGYMKQLQAMLEERPELIVIASTNGLTPLAAAVRKGNLNTVRFLLQAGANVNQALNTGQTPLHLAVLGGHAAIIDLLLEKEADFQARDINGLRVEHYAVDSCNVEVVRCILDKGGDVEALDNNGWTPLFRAICQESTTETIEELTSRGANAAVTDRAGLTLAAAARLLKDKNGRRRDSVLRLVDAMFPTRRHFRTSPGSPRRYIVFIHC